jgi:WD40 repeat protein
MIAIAGCNRFDDLGFCGDGQIELFAFSRSKFDRLASIPVPNFFVRKLLFSADEGELVINNGEEILLWDITSVTNPKQLGSLSRDTFIYDMAIDSEGKRLVLGEYQQMSLWDISEPMQPEQLSTRPGFSGYITHVTFDKNGTILASASEEDKTIMLWDLSDPRRLVPMYSLGRLEHNVNRIEIRPDGKTLISAFSEGYGLMIIWDLDPTSWIQKACQIAGRNFTQEEWVQYFPDEAYRTTCPQWPAGY